MPKLADFMAMRDLVDKIAEGLNQKIDQRGKQFFSKIL